MYVDNKKMVDFNLKRYCRLRCHLEGRVENSGRATTGARVSKLFCRFCISFECRRRMPPLMCQESLVPHSATKVIWGPFLCLLRVESTSTAESPSPDGYKFCRQHLLMGLCAGTTEHSTRGRRITETSVVGDVKECTLCGEVRESTMFSTNNQHLPLRLQSQCKPCNAMGTHFRSERYALQRQSMPPPTVKNCPLCSKTLPTSSFAGCRGNKYGLQRVCKACTSEQRAELRVKRNELFGLHPPFAPPGQERVCSQCGSTRPWTDFVRDRYSMHGIKPLCLECDRDTKRLQRRLRKEV